MAEVPEVDYTAEEEAAMGGETQPEGETPSVKTPEGVEADPTEVRTSAKPLEEVKQESRHNQAVTTPGEKAQEEVGTSKGASSSGQENPGQTGVEPEQGEYWQYSQEEWEQWEKREASLSQDVPPVAEIRRRLVCPKAPAGQKGARSAQAQGGAFKSMEGQ